MIQYFVIDYAKQIFPSHFSNWASRLLYLHTAATFGLPGPGQMHYLLDVRKTVIKEGVVVSTVFTGVHDGPDPPLVYETMVFGGKMDEFKYKYATREHALEGHKLIVKECRQREGITLWQRFLGEFKYKYATREHALEGHKLIVKEREGITLWQRFLDWASD